MATEMCGCFNTIKDSIPAEAMAVFNEAAAAPVAGEVYRNGLAKLSPEVATKLNNALLSFTKPGSAGNDCLENMDKKYKTVGEDKNEVTRKMIDAIQNNKECALMTALMKMEMEKQAK